MSEITAKIVADSISYQGVRLTTFELEYPRFVHAEFMTHRLFSRNAASSRAIPVKAMIDNLKQNYAHPHHWGKNQPGMQAKEECTERLHLNDYFVTREAAWEDAMHQAIYYANQFNEAGYHKQIVNRLLEPFAQIKVVCTATDYNNFFWLRAHPDAQPEIKILAEKMLEVRDKTTPVKLGPTDWHTPYFGEGYWNGAGFSFDYSVEDALAISASCCAQVSYRKSDDSLDKARDIYKRLIESKPCHASPFEHQARPMVSNAGYRELGVTHQDRGGQWWSGNFRGWVQHRQLIDGNTVTG